MPDVLLFGGLFSAVGVLVYLLRDAGVRRRSRRRLVAAAERPAETARAAAAAAAAAVFDDGPAVARHRLVPWVAAGVLAAACYFPVGIPLLFDLAIGVIGGLLAFQAEVWWAERQTARLEAQLAEAIDLMVGALHAGAGAVAAMGRAADEVRDPLGGIFRDALARIRYGDDPRAVMRRLTARVPVETFRLFGTTLSVHWEVGGSLAPTLATVGRVVRDRIEVARRIRSLTAQARVSTVMLLVTTYFIAVLMWRQNPERMRQFLASPIGSAAVAGTMVLQAVGVVWQAVASRVKY